MSIQDYPGGGTELKTRKISIMIITRMITLNSILMMLLKMNNRIMATISMGVKTTKAL
jgi:hypothetical protein